MIIYNVNKEDLNKAIKIVNKKYDNNLYANFLDGGSYSYTNVRYKFRLYYRDINKSGSRCGINNNEPKYACYHAHHDFFNVIIKINKNAVIQLYEDWIIKKVGDKIIGNKLKFNNTSMHRLKPSSFLCRCKD